ncbi:hypothetical protein [Geminocystis sp. NIES-3709]|uniref:hypothetical protein n=1 Tax=Geminocystis sp. NIES-3709 TaxID=1617448 RepID=UPI0005FC4D34|nr:hypothetical protein [Geminocystis sp. NIES-3709]BAQ65551.1 phage tail fiber protein [Geminocystis sp. NIES-3709]
MDIEINQTVIEVTAQTTVIEVESSVTAIEVVTNPVQIKGDTGEQGIQGEQGLKGDKGDDGENGLSAYQEAVENGFVGTEEEWLNSFYDRSNHTGTQSISTIENLQNSLDQKQSIGDYATGSQGAKADTALQPSDLTNYETTNQLNTRDTNNRNRANHTGTQSIATIVNLQETLDSKQPISNSINYPSGLLIDSSICSNALSTLAVSQGVTYVFPFKPLFNFRASTISVWCTVVGAGSPSCAIYLFTSDSSGLPTQQEFYGSITLNTTGEKSLSIVKKKIADNNHQNTNLSEFLFEKDKLYWWGFYSSSTGTIRAIPLTNATPLGIVNSSNTSYATHYRITTPPVDLNEDTLSDFGNDATLTNGVIPCIRLLTTTV